ncbi:MAG: FkbM family methyltransferase [Desulfobacterales bacterium]|nr:FkbM family methyltransferase [Desulfobacterales bacterium]
MRTFISKFAMVFNEILKPFGIKLISVKTDIFNMHSAILRIYRHGIKVDNIIDIGASNGIWSSNALPHFPQSKFVAIEPLSERKTSLQNLANKYHNFDYELCVAGEADGVYATLNVADDLDGSTVNGHGGQSRQVPVKMIDTIVFDRNLTGSFLLKFDTHGYEVQILKGALETLKNTSVIIMEVYNFRITENSLRFHEMCAHMETLGFRCYDIVDLMVRDYDNAFWQMDICFCRSDSKIFHYAQYL